MKKQLLVALALTSACAAPASAGIVYDEYNYPTITPDYEVDGIGYLLTEEGTLAVTARDAVTIGYITSNDPANPYEYVTRTGGLDYEGSVKVPSEVYIESLDKTLPVTKVIDGTFMDCHDLLSVSLPASATEMGLYVFAGCPKLEEVKLGDIEIVQAATFQGCKALKTLKIPETVTKVDNGAFYDCGVETLSFSQKLNDIHYSALVNAYALKSVTVNVESPYDFLNTEYQIYAPENCVLYVPKESVTEYQKLEAWSGFAEIRPIAIEAIGEISASAQNPTESLYDLTGRKVTSHASGLIITPGRKLLLRR
ncbi:MAG: leucine-rich repeat domain-containing protein [Muribaculaceae bacterium]|nr:leucine-rich repeat domain-containing protein [Muribaculaceae bacterium]